jgi:radical SAM-linked protein
MVQVNNLPYVTLRVKFKKVGRLQYISHLDLVRTMYKILVRAKLPMWYTEGFNPKPKMVFAAPLSIGAESVCEFMDIRLVEKILPDKVKEVLNKNMTDEMQVLEAYYPTAKFTELKWLTYTMKIKTEMQSADFAVKCNELFTKEQIFVLKKTKSGEKTVDIKPLIRSASAVADGDMTAITMVLSADQSCFLNPEYIADALRDSFGVLTEEKILTEYYTVMRERAHRADMSEFR